MTTETWAVPHGTGGGVGHTRAITRVVLAVAHGVASGKRLSDAIAAMETIQGVQIVFTTPPGPRNGVDEFFVRTGALTTPWQQAVRDRFDLVVSTSATSVHQLSGPLLLLASLGVDGRPVDHHGRDAITAVRRLLDRPAGARRSPFVIGVPRHRDLDLLRRTSPDVGRHATTVGDPTFDLLMRLTGMRAALRAQLELAADDRVGLLLSSRGPRSLLGQSPRALESISRVGLRRGDRVFCSLHPDVWTGHGVRQVRAWTAGAARDGLELVPPHRDWRPLAAVSDYVIGDHGVATSYAVALAKPVLLARVPVPVGTGTDLAGPPVLTAFRHLGLVPATVTSAEAITSAPLRSSVLLRRLAARLLGLPS